MICGKGIWLSECVWGDVCGMLCVGGVCGWCVGGDVCGVMCVCDDVCVG